MRTLKNLARSVLRAIHASRLRRRSRPLALSPRGPTLVLAPHPDDEALGCGALLARRCAEGAAVQVAYFTDGSGSHPHDPALTPATLATTRAAEARQAMRLLGLGEEKLHFLGAPDGRLKHLDAAQRAAWSERLRALLTAVQPAELLLPCRNDGSSEHEAMFALLPAALAALPGPRPRVLEFPVWSWWSPRHLARVVAGADRVWRQPTEGFAAQKRALLRCYPSQTAPVLSGAEPPLPPAFVAAFDTPDEYFFETTPPP